MAKVGILKVKKLVDALLDYVRQDLDGFLVRCFDEEDVVEDISYLDLALEIFSRTELDSRRIETRLMFDVDRALIPTIHVREPAKNKGSNDGIGYIDEDFYENIDTTYHETRRRSFSSQYEIVITSSNRHEVIIIEEVLLGLLIGSQDTLSLNSPFYQFTFSVKEMMANNELVPQPLFIKSIMLNMSYDKTYPDLSSNELLTSILFQHNILSE